VDGVDVVVGARSTAHCVRLSKHRTRRLAGAPTAPPETRGNATSLSGDTNGVRDRLTTNEQSARHPAGPVDARGAIGRKHGEWIRPYFLSPEKLQELAIELAPAYRVAAPFPHAVIDGLVPDDVIGGLLDEFPGLDDAAWTRHHDRHQRKLQGHRRELHGPLTRQIIDQFMSAEFLAFLEALTGIEGLITDPSMLGGGLHQTGPAGYLNIHTDQTYEPRLRLERRVNMILYLNRDWSSSYGGDLELWDADRRSCVTTIAPLDGRMVVFNTDTPSWHGHPRPLNCPTGTSRRSVALYYFTSPVGTTRSGLRSSDRWPGPGNRLHVTKNYVSDMLPPALMARLIRWRQSRSQP
jgi:hypothetical protein